MKKSSDERVQKFLEDTSEVDSEKYTILQKCREIVFAAGPETGERMMYGGIMFSIAGNDFGGIFASKKHVSFEFNKGHELDDPNNFLEGSGKFRRHLKLKSVDNVHDKNVAFFVKQVMTGKA